MKRTQPSVSWAAVAIAVAAFLTAAWPALAQRGVAEGKREITGKNAPGIPWESYENVIPDAAEIATKEWVDPAAEAFAKSCRDNAKVLSELRAKVVQKANQPGQSSTIRNQGLKLAEEAEKESGKLSKAATWTEKAATVLKIIDFVSTASKAGGYLAEGDRIGATGVVIDDIAKKGTAALSAFGLSWIPGVGPVVGAAAGEEFHEQYTRPAIEARTDQIRVAEAKQKMLGPDIPGEKVMDDKGNVRTLPPDMYVNKETGNIARRTPEQQQAYESQYRADTKNAANSDHPLDQAARDLKDGKINEKQFDKIVDQYNNPDKNRDKEEPGAKNNRRKGPTIPTREGDEEAGDHKGDKDQEEAAEKTGEDEEAAADEEEPVQEEAPKGNVAILEKVTPVKLAASGSFDGDYSFKEFRNIVTTTMTLSFWNVGGLAPGYGGATMTIHIKSSMGPEENDSCSGSFSGGPNGTFHLSCQQGGSKTMQLSNGTSISAGGTSLTVNNPKAFADWPK